MNAEEQKAYDLAVDNHARAMDRVAELELELAALKAKAAPVGDLREAFEAWLGIKPCGAAHDLAVKAFQSGAAYQRQSDWQASGADCDSNILRNPDAKAWADFFVAVFPGQADKHGLMLGWFANAMMAMHDFLKAQQRQSGVVVPHDLLMRVLEPITSEGYINAKHELLSLMDEFARLNGKEVGRG